MNSFMTKKSMFTNAILEYKWYSIYMKMNQFTRYLSILVIALSGFNIFPVNAQITPVADAYVNGAAASAALNFGTDVVLRVKKGSSTIYSRKTFIKFDLGNVQPADTLKYAVLKLNVTTFPKVMNIQVLQTADNWTETGITWNNAPVSGALVYSRQITGTGIYTWDISNYLRQEYRGDKVLSLVVDDVIGNAVEMYFSSRESGTNGPVIEFSATPPPHDRTVELPPFISSGMILQREMPLRFHGWGSPGDSVKAVFTRQTNIYTQKALIDTNGRWNMEMPAQPATSSPCTLTFELIGVSGTLQTLNDILIGDVWFFGGQSNMEKKVNYCLDSAVLISEANNFPYIRSFKSSYNNRTTPQEHIKSTGGWFACNTTNLGANVSAIGYIFSRNLYNSLNVPIGMIQSYRGGTEIETWMSRDKINNDPDLCLVNGRIASGDSTNADNYISCNFNGQIYPLKGIPLKGMCFIQGESNTKRAQEYRLMLKKLIEDWRTQWGMGDVPFLYAQTFNMGISANRTIEEIDWADLREQQQQVMTLDNVNNYHLCVTLDTNEDPDNPDALIRIHPKNKRPVGDRMALQALKYVYGKDVFADSPIPTRFPFRNDTVFVVYKNVGAGLKIKAGDTSLKGFVLAGYDKVYKAATATIVNDSTIAVYSSLVSNPVSLRYGWAKNPDCNLYNSANLPAFPIRTDNYASGMVYATFPSTCNATSNAVLSDLKIDGTTVSSFSSSVYLYFYDIGNSKIIPQVTATAADTKATVSIIPATLISDLIGRKSVITVIAEDGTKKFYEVVFTTNSTSAISDISLKGITVYNSNYKLIADVTSSDKGKIMIYDALGQCLLQSEYKANSRNEYSILQSGIFLIRLVSENGKQKIIKINIK